jgi:hypothetical protein
MRTWLDRQFFRPRSALPFGIFRAGLGFILLCYYLQVSPRAYAIFAHTQIPNSAFIILQIITIAAASFTMLGFHARLSTLLLLLCHTAFYLLNPSAFWGWGLMSVYFLTLLLLTPCEAVSLDRRNQGPLAAPAWNYLVFQILICSIYAMTVLHRLATPEWRDGNALMMALADGFVARFPNVDWLAYQTWLRPFSYLGWGIEALGALMLFLVPLQPFIALGLIGFHLSLELTAMVGYWQYLLILSMVFFVPGKWLPLETPHAHFPFKSWIPTSIVALTFILLLDALPTEIVPRPVNQVRRIFALPIEQLGLTGLRGMTMYKTTRNIGRQCFFVAGDNTSGELQEVYSSEQQCHPPDVRIFTDEYFATLARYYLSGNKRKLGREFCASGNYRRIYLFSKQENLVTAGTTFTRIPETTLSLAFDCIAEREQIIPDTKKIENIRNRFIDKLSW